MITLNDAVNIVRRVYQVWPVAYTRYNDMYIFRVITNEKNKASTILVAVDMLTGIVGPFSLAFVLDDIDAILNSMQKLSLGGK